MAVPKKLNPDLKDRLFEQMLISFNFMNPTTYALKLLGLDQPEVNTALNPVFPRSGNTSEQTKLDSQIVTFRQDVVVVLDILSAPIPD